MEFTVEFRDGQWIAVDQEGNVQPLADVAPVLARLLVGFDGSIDEDTFNRLVATADAIATGRTSDVPPGERPGDQLREIPAQQQQGEDATRPAWWDETLFGPWPPMTSPEPRLVTDEQGNTTFQTPEPELDLDAVNRASIIANRLGLIPEEQAAPQEQPPLQFSTFEEAQANAPPGFQVTQRGGFFTVERAPQAQQRQPSLDETIDQAILEGNFDRALELDAQRDALRQSGQGLPASQAASLALQHGKNAEEIENIFNILTTGPTGPAAPPTQQPPATPLPTPQPGQPTPVLAQPQQQGPFTSQAAAPTQGGPFSQGLPQPFGGGFTTARTPGVDTEEQQIRAFRQAQRPDRSRDVPAGTPELFPGAPDVEQGVGEQPTFQTRRFAVPEGAVRLGTGFVSPGGTLFTGEGSPVFGNRRAVAQSLGVQPSQIEQALERTRSGGGVLSQSKGGGPFSRRQQRADNPFLETLTEIGSRQRGRERQARFVRRGVPTRTFR